MAGQALGWLGFGAQVVALTIGPISLVQAFAAGGLAVSVPLASGIFRHHVARIQMLAVLLIAACLATLPLALGHHHHPMRTGVLLGATLTAIVIAVALGLRGLASLQAVAAGMFYGVADAAIKAVSVHWGHHGIGGVLSPWTALAAAATFGGFLTFQAALRRGDAVSAISLMTALTAVLAVGFGALTFGESLGAGPAAVAAHLAAIALGARVRSAARPGPGTDCRGDPGAGDDMRALAAVRRGLVWLGAALASLLMLVLAVLAGTGLLYALRSTPILADGPRIHDALPLLQLAGRDSQPLGHVIVAWLAAGLVLGLALIRFRPLRRTLGVAVLGLLLLLFASDASFALARNLHLTHVLAHRTPPLGAWIEALVLSTGCALPRPLAAARRPVRWGQLAARLPVPGKAV